MTKLSEQRDDGHQLKPLSDVSNMRPPRAQSPKQTKRVARTDSLRQRCDARNTEEIIRFVRDIQFERQPTLLRIQKKAPLPGIAKNGLKTGSSDSGFIDRGLDSTDSEEDALDNEILYTQQKRSDARPDPLFINMLTCPRGNTRTSNDYAILSRSLPQGQMDIYNNNNQRISKQNSFVKHSKVSNSKRGYAHTGYQTIGKQLPPLSRDDLPDRPSAPSPSRTPPIADYSFIEEEPVDYLDL